MSDLYPNNETVSFVEGFTIDGPTSRDLDDALWLEEQEGRPLVRVCIAEVASEVLPDSRRDVRARERGFTRYFRDMNAPMLPRVLAEDSLSLLPLQPRRAICIEMLLDEGLDCCRVSVRQATLFSRAQLSYPQAAAIIQGEILSEHQEIAPMLGGLARLSSRLLEKRQKRGELALYDLRSGWTLNEEGQFRRLSRDEANIGYIIVQEMMLLTNRTIAEYLLRTNRPVLFRNHEANVAAPDRAYLQQSVENAIAHPDHFDSGTLRQRLNLLLSRARYEPYVKGHYGLNLPVYLHFTSPLRRYADLINQRILLAYLQGIPSPYTTDELEVIGTKLNLLTEEERERKNEPYRRRKQAEIERHLQAQAPQIVALPDKDMYRLIRRASEESEPPEALVLSVEQRFATNQASTKELFALLFECLQEGEGWRRLRQVGLEWVQANPERAISVLSMGVGLCAWPAANYSYSGSGAQFACRADIRLAETDYRTQEWHDSTKKIAQQKAAVALCYLLCGHDLPESSVLEAPPAIPKKTVPPSLPLHPEKAPAATLSLDDIAVPAMVRNRLDQFIQSGEFVSGLFYLCQKTHRKHPRFHFEQTSVGDEKYSLCRVTLTWPEGTLTQEATGKDAAEAKQKAVQAILNALQDASTY